MSLTFYQYLFIDDFILITNLTLHFRLIGKTYRITFLMTLIRYGSTIIKKITRSVPPPL